MKKTLQLIVLMLVSGALFTGCGSKATKENYDKVAIGMTKEQVTKVLGRAKHKKVLPALGPDQMEFWVYDKMISITFWNGQVSDTRWEEPQDATGATKERVTGAFGFKLGELAPAGTEVIRGEHGVYAMISDFTNAPPFDSINVSMTEDGRVYEVSGTTGGIDTYSKYSAAKDAIEQTLEEKYGLKSQCRGRVPDTSFVFGDDKRSVSLTLNSKPYRIEVTYADEDLSRQTQEARKKREKAAAKTSASGL